MHLTIYGSFEEHMPSGVASINYDTIRYISPQVIFFLIDVLFFFHEINREYVGIFLGVSLAESFNLVSNV